MKNNSKSFLLQASEYQFLTIRGYTLLSIQKNLYCAVYTSYVDIDFLLPAKAKEIKANLEWYHLLHAID